MKESVGSLRAYFFVVALLGAFQTFGLATVTLVLLFSSPLFGLGFAVICVMNLGLTAGYFYLSLKLPDLLLRSPETPAQIILASMGVQVFGFLLSMLSGATQLGQLLFGLAITAYLLGNVKRLASEAEQQALAAKSQSA